MLSIEIFSSKTGKYRLRRIAIHVCDLRLKIKEGLIEVYTGNGKGKTTAAFGLHSGLPGGDTKCTCCSS
jgi:ATP:corrinoid adenosyltransferase